MCVYGSLWAFADTRVGAPVLEAAHHPDFFFIFIIIIVISGCVVWGFQTLILFFSTDDSLREFSSFLKNLEDQRELMVRTTSQNLPGSQEKKSVSVSVCLLPKACSEPSHWPFHSCSPCVTPCFIPQPRRSTFPLTFSIKSAAQSSFLVNGEVILVLRRAVAVV